jgi:hypothetical protein
VINSTDGCAGDHVLGIRLHQSGHGASLLSGRTGIAKGRQAPLIMNVFGGVFAAASLRIGAQGPQLIAASLIIVVVLIIFVPSMGPIVAHFRFWWLAVAAGVAIVLSWVGTCLLLRPATVR